MKSKSVKADGPSPIATRTTHNKVDLAKDICFLCNEPAGSKNLHRACTHDIDIRVRKCALQLQDTDLLAKLAPGDMVALEAKYHSKCLVDLYNRARATTDSRNADTGTIRGDLKSRSTNASKINENMLKGTVYEEIEFHMMMKEICVTENVAYGQSTIKSQVVYKK